MKTISINKELVNLPFSVVAYTMDVDNNITSEVDNLINETIFELKENYKIEDVVNIDMIKVSRDGYKKLKIDPSRYRLATESLIRRIVKGKGLYRINDIVDLGNVLSIKLKRSVCVVDLNKIIGDIYITKGKLEDDYEGINRGKINITNMPVYRDDISNFGTPTSDTTRCMVTNETNKILVMVICFEKLNDVTHKYISNEIIDLYTKYTNAKNIIQLRIINEV